MLLCAVFVIELLLCYCVRCLVIVIELLLCYCVLCLGIVIELLLCLLCFVRLEQTSLL